MKKVYTRFAQFKVDLGNMSSHLSVVISNQEFISAYDKLGIASVNLAQKHRKPHWEQYTAIFKECYVDLHPKPTDKVKLLSILIQLYHFADK